MTWIIDVDDGREYVIFSHLESVLTFCTEKSKVTINSPHHQNFVTIIMEWSCLTPAASESSTPHGLQLQVNGKQLLPNMTLLPSKLFLEPGADVQCLHH
ncbi:hypothetical protein J6590_018002 [Homalodisca vitripennis]|nr:hypothetical protein J6590_018002 [Homalodisca vitripennis]